MKLKDKVALITGGGTGIGTAIARRFVSEGARICITGRRKELLEQVARSLPSGSVVTCAGDVSKYDDVQLMVKTVLEFGNRLDVLVNNAGMDPPGTVVDVDPELWRKVVEVNLTGPFLLMKAFIPHMIKVGGGSIINIASLAGLRCLPAMPAYCSSKAGLIMLTKQVALDYGRYNIRCNVVCPGAVRTEMLENSIGHLAEVMNTDLNSAFKYFSSNVPLRRVSKPDEIPGVCTYLASDDSSFMTGAALVIDGGASIVDVSGAAVSSMGMNWGDK